MPAIRAIPGRCAASTWRSSPPTAPPGGRPFDGEEGERAAKLYERVFLGYGDDSIAQVGGAHVACEWVSNILTKVLQRGRLAAYLEQSTRYIPYDQPLPATRRRLPLLPRRASWARSSAPRWTSCSRSTRARWSRSRPGRRSAGRAATASPRAPGSARSAPRRSTCCAACCPAATLSHVGIFASGQAYEQLILRLMASPLPEARDYGGMILARAAAGDAELRLPGAAPRPRRRVDRLPGAPPRGRPRAGCRGSASTAAAPARTRHRSSWSTSTAPRRICSPPACSSRAATPETEILARLDVLDRDERAELLGGAGRRADQPPPPPRPWLRGAALSLRDRLRLRRLPRPAAPPDADLPVAAARPGPRGRGARRGARGRRRRRVRAGAGDLPRRVRAAGRRPGYATRRPTRSASPTGSATRSTSTRARRCT